MNLWHYTKMLLQLLLAPARGWEDISEAGIKPPTMERKGFYPLLAVVFATSYLGLIYSRTSDFWGITTGGIAVVCALFVSVYLIRIFLNLTLPHLSSDGKVNQTKTAVFALCLTGLNALYVGIDNILPTTFTFVKFLPLLSVIVVFKSAVYICIGEDNQVSYTALASAAVIGIPLLIYVILLLII